MQPKVSHFRKSWQPFQGKNKKRWLPFLICGLISLAMSAAVLTTSMFREGELKAFDYRMRWCPSGKVNKQIYIAAIDDSSIALLGRWPWPRKIQAAFLKSLTRYPPGVIGMDILFTESERGGVEGDQATAHYAELLGNVVFAGYIGQEDGKIISPIPSIGDTGKTGFINIFPHNDGITRKIPLVIKSGHKYFPSFTLQVLCDYLNTDFNKVKVDLGHGILVPGFGKIPIDSDGSMWISYVGDQHVFHEMAYQQIISWGEEDGPVQQFAGKMLLAGITATGIGDTGHTPINTNVPSITVHANSLNTILNKDFILKVPLWINLLTAVIVILLILAINHICRPVKAAGWSLLLLFLYIGINVLLFVNNIWVDILAPGAGMLAAFVTVTVYKYGCEEKRRRWIKKVFTHFVSPAVIDNILKHPERLRLGGETRTVTVLFLDLRNFTSFCEKKSPRDVVALLNDSFDWMTEIILKHQGMLDKYIGDAIMALFGAPTVMAPEAQAYRAVKAAVEIAAQWRRIGGHREKGLDIGIGISTGTALTGNMGSRYIFNYTAVGDTVNIAARINGLTGKYAANIIMNDYTYRLVKDKFNIMPLGSVPVKGREEPVAIYGISDQNKNTAAAITVT